MKTIARKFRISGRCQRGKQCEIILLRMTRQQAFDLVDNLLGALSEKDDGGSDYGPDSLEVAISGCTRDRNWLPTD